MSTSCGIPEWEPCEDEDEGSQCLFQSGCVTSSEEGGEDGNVPGPIVEASGKVHALLEQVSRPVAEAYAKNVHAVAVDVQDRIAAAGAVLHEVIAYGQGSPEQMMALHSGPRNVLDSLYNFKSRIDKFSDFQLPGVGVKYSPSYGKEFDRAIVLRRYSVHENEFFYKYVTGEGEVPCPHDTCISPYEGEIKGVIIEYRSNSRVQTWEYSNFLRSVEASVVQTLNKYHAFIQGKVSSIGHTASSCDKETRGG